MNKKMIMGAVCALACATNLTFSQPVEAGFLGFGNSGIMSAHEQERSARRLNKEEMGSEEPEMYSDSAYEALPHVRKIQQRICNVNGIQIVADNFTDKYDYMTKVHPVNLVDGYVGAYSSGAGHFYIGMEGVKARGVIYLKNQYDYMSLEQTIAHETTYCIEGHCFIRGNDEKIELLADKGSIKYTDNLPEGGLGVYLVAYTSNNSYPDIARKIYNSFEKQTNNKVSIESSSDVLYRGRDGVYYPIIEERRGTRSPANAYFGGQMADCMSKNVLSMGNIRIIPNHLKNEINYKGDCLLACESSSLPNGYRILTELYGDETTLQDNLDTIKSKVRRGIVPLKKSMYSNMRVVWIHKDNSAWKMWLACAIAYDFETNCGQNMRK